MSYWDDHLEADNRREDRVFRLLESVDAVLANPSDHKSRAALAAAAEEWNRKVLGSNVRRWRERKAQEEAEAAAKTLRLSGFEELPDAPAGHQCEVRADVTWSRMTEWRRCDRVAKRIVLDEARRERMVCSQHAKKVLADGKPPWGWSEDKTHESWYRVHKIAVPK